MDFDKVLALIKAMNAEGVEYITFGAIALNAHGIVRATTDADFFIKPTADNVDRLKRAIRQVWDDPHVDEISADDLAGDYPSVMYGPPDEEFGIDFVSRLGTAFSYDDLAWQVIEIAGVPTRVVTARTLYDMKRDTVRGKDKLDAQWLREQFGFEES
ncbi:MAG TPA: hypothetical protein VMU84_15730 [Thermoanaerobaculia bacterium]|nr:hypothetical protein [Thermoanaerobaculia bacterium]